MKMQMKAALVLVLLTGLMLAACSPVQSPAEIPVSGQEQQNPTDVPTQEQQPVDSGRVAAVTVTLTGMLWNDQCEAEPGTAPDPMPAGCVVNAMGAAQANGILDAGESPLAGVAVDLGVGPCPSTGLASAVTNAAGQFSFTAELPADRTVCVSVDAGGEANAALLLDGQWTSPADSQGVLAAWTITVPDGQNALADLNFGWDYYAMGTSTTFTVGETEANCRSGPGTLYPAVVIVKADEQYPILGKNTDASWFVVDIGNGSNCWVSAVVGSAAGSLDGVSVVSAPPPPQPTTAAAQSDGGSSNSSAPTSTPGLHLLNCRDYTTKATCEVYTSCKWYGSPLNICNKR